MHYFIYADADATLYEGSATQSRNTGLDEILEVRKDMNDSATVINVSRALIKFDLTEISNFISDGLIPSNDKSEPSASYFLNLYDAGSTGLTSTSQLLYAHIVSQSWTAGEGTFHDDPETTDGVSWRYRVGQNDGTQWISGSNDVGGTWYGDFDTTGSVNWDLLGEYPSTHMTASAGKLGRLRYASQSFDYGSTDMRMDVTEPISILLDSSSAYPNEGFIIKRSGSVGNEDSNCPEGDSSEYGQFKFFSRDTNTIYQPKLEVVWKDFVYSTGSTALTLMSGSQLDDIVFYMKGMRDSYKENSKIKFRLAGRQRYPAKTYETTPRALQVTTFPSGTLFYSVKDALTEETIIPFDQYTAVSCDSSGHYFNLWMNGLQAERYYKVLYRFVSGSGTIGEINDIHDNDFTFKVEK
ncbi:hypothetical protein HOE22_01895 [Candidatus Woesearchaeota archaeon]|jgi:hypothetical protein|nr:hypothetical protein [Candidatus Woesearchaeota archaeon]MBT7558728.1 hypothetical protein [Candidatus Woesearchaeota archaeon]